MNKRLIFFLALTAFLPSCLQTAADLRNNPNRQQQPAASAPSSSSTPPPIVTKQQKEAAEVLRSDDINKDFRELNGRVEVVENQLNDLKENEKVKSLEAKVAQLEGKISLLEATVTDLHTQSKKAIASGVQGSDLKEVAKVESIPYQEATKLFEKGKWEDAVLAYEEYRRTNPGGKNYAEATYKIGLCFQNLGSKNDAKAFFKEVVDKYPKSKEAGLAKTKLKKL